MSKQKLQTIEKRAILEYLDYSGDQVNILTLARWLESRSNGLFHVVKGARRNLSITEELKRHI